MTTITKRATLSLPALKCFKLPKDCEHFLVVGPHCWGRGATIEEALMNAKVKPKDVWSIAAGVKPYVDEVGTAYAKQMLWSSY